MVGLAAIASGLITLSIGVLASAFSNAGPPLGPANQVTYRLPGVVPKPLLASAISLSRRAPSATVVCSRGSALNCSHVMPCNAGFFATCVSNVARVIPYTPLALLATVPSATFVPPLSALANIRNVGSDVKAATSTFCGGAAGIGA